MGPLFKKKKTGTVLYRKSFQTGKSRVHILFTVCSVVQGWSEDQRIREEFPLGKEWTGHDRYTGILAKVHIKVPRLKANLNFGPPQVQSVQGGPSCGQVYRPHCMVKMRSPCQPGILRMTLLTLPLSHSPHQDCMYVHEVFLYFILFLCLFVFEHSRPTRQ